MIKTTTAAQRRDRRRELEEKYGLRSTTLNINRSPSEEIYLQDFQSGSSIDWKRIVHDDFLAFRNSSIEIIFVLR